MVDRPWSNKRLSKGQIVQALERAGCYELEQPVAGVGTWKPPVGDVFTISYDDCDAAYLESVIDLVVRRVEQKQRGHE